MNRLTKQRGFTLVEMLVVVTIIGMLVAMLMPALFVPVRRPATPNAETISGSSASGCTCSPIGIRSSGTARAADFRRDGCPDTWGWVADLVNSGAAKPGDMLCPTNPIKYQEKWNDMLGSDTTSSKDGATADRLQCGTCYAGGSDFGGTGVTTAARADYITAILEKGYNSNYAASWFLVRGGVKFEPATTPLSSKIEVGSFSFKGIKMTTGPLTRRTTDTSRVATSVIPLLGDAAPGDPDEALLTTDLMRGPSTAPAGFADDGNTKTYAAAGERLCESFCDGPAQYDAAAFKLVLMPKTGVSLEAQMTAEASPTGIGDPATGSNYWLQDTRDFYALHGGGNKLSCNVLMADGSVKEFSDTNGDHYLNPGFLKGTTLTADQAKTIGYSDGTVDLPPNECFSGLFLVGDVGKRAKFE